MAEVAQRYALDLLHVHYAIPHSISALLAQQMLARNRRLPFITTLHGTDITLVGTDRSYFPITKFSIEQSNGITSISEFISKRTAEVFGVDNPVRVIPNFVNLETYRPDQEKTAARRFAPAGEKLLIHLSNFRPVKRVLDCIHILARVLRAVPAHLLMVGDGPDRGPAENLTRDLGIDDHVSFLGKQDHVERLIPLAHVLLMPSELEAFGLAALEAMACGVPPIGTAAGGVPELITHGVDGFIEPVGDVDAQAERAIELLTDDRLHARMAVAARKTAADRFSTEQIIPEYERYYEEVCGRQPAMSPASSR
jgi:N-acetyl-alpha-D-glucosaminyl L-malate synthase BshA